MNTEEKTASHGTWHDTATFAQAIKMLMRRGRNWDALPPEHKEALEGVATAIARILNGDPGYPKHWHNAAGYLRMVAIEPGVNAGLEANISRLAAQRSRPRPVEPDSPA